jgi:hypothetical protein
VADSKSFFGRSHPWQAELENLEMQLLDPDVRSNKDALERLLHDDFIEFGSSGRVYQKRMLIDMVTSEEHARVIIRDFAIRQLSEGTALVTYRSVGQAGQEARRSSVWVNQEGRWRLVFHQGTRIPNSWGSVS